MVSSSCQTPGEIGGVQDREEIGERLAPRPEQARGVAPVEEHADLAAELVEQALEVEPVAVVGQVGKAGREAAELAETRGLLPARDGFLDQARAPPAS